MFVVALGAEVVVAIGVPASQTDSAANIARALADHQDRLVVVACLSVVCVAAFPIYLSKLHGVLRGDPDRAGFLGPLVLVGGVFFVALHGISDIGITGLLGAKLASYGAVHDQGMSYALYLATYALDSVGDVFGSLFALAAGLLVLETGALPRWLAWVSIAGGILLFVQAFALGGVIATFGVVVDIIGFVLLLIFVLASSVVALRREHSRADTPAGTTP